MGMHIEKILSLPLTCNRYPHTSRLIHYFKSLKSWLHQWLDNLFSLEGWITEVWWNPVVWLKIILVVLWPKQGSDEIQLYWKHLCILNWSHFRLPTHLKLDLPDLIMLAKLLSRKARKNSPLACMCCILCNTDYLAEFLALLRFLFISFLHNLAWYQMFLTIFVDLLQGQTASITYTGHNTSQWGKE